MITRIEGMADNHALVFAPGEDGYWTAEVPPDLEDGVYYVTLRAWDAAGNSAYYATILLMVDADGMLAVYRPIVPACAGTQDDPIPWVYGMDCGAGLYYTHDGQVWLCLSDMAPCVWAPGSDPAMWVAA